MATLQTFGAETYMPFVRCLEEEAYEPRLTQLVGELIDTLLMADPVLVKAVNFSKAVFDRPFYSLWFIRLHRYWDKDQDFEMRLRSRSVRTLVFAGWHFVEVHSVPSLATIDCLFVCSQLVGTDLTVPSSHFAYSACLRILF